MERTSLLLPSFAELEEHVEAWIERGEVRNEVFLTAGEASPAKKPQTGLDGLMAQIMGLREELGQRFEILEDKVQDLQQHPQLRKPAPPVLKAKPKPGASPDLEYGKGEEEMPKRSGRGDPAELIARMKELAPGGPRRTPDEPGRGQTAAEMAPLEPHGDMDVDELMKLAMVKLLTGKNKAKSKKLPGLPAWEMSGSSEGEDEHWSSTSKGGKGIEQVDRLRLAMKTHPDRYLERMEQRMLRALELLDFDSSIPHQYAKTIPVGKSRTAGYCVWGLAEVHKLLIEGKVRQARLHVVRLQAGLEQFLIDESWVVGSRLLGVEEPPWGHWATQDLQALRKQYQYCRLIESTWLGAYINQLKEEEWLLKKRQAFRGGVPNNPKKGDGKSASSEAA